MAFYFGPLPALMSGPVPASLRSTGLSGPHAPPHAVRRLRAADPGVAGGPDRLPLRAQLLLHGARGGVADGVAHRPRQGLVTGETAHVARPGARGSSWAGAGGGPGSPPAEASVMSKIVLMMSVSLDGFIEGPNRELDWHLVDDELHRHFNEELAAMGAFLDGRVTYELMADFWPTADADPASPGPWSSSPASGATCPSSCSRGRWSGRLEHDRRPRGRRRRGDASSRPSPAATWRSAAPTSPRPSCATT